MTTMRNSQPMLIEDMVLSLLTLPWGPLTSRLSFCVAMALCILGLACGTNEEGTGVPEVTGDTAVLFVSGAAALKPVVVSNLHTLDPPGIKKKLVYSVGRQASGVVFRHIAGAVLLPDSSLVVADRGLAELVFFDQYGNIRRRVGRESEGLGGDSHIARLGIGLDGTLFVYDRRQRRFTFLDSSGFVTDVKHMERSEEIVPLVRLQSGAFLSVFEPLLRLPAGVQRGPLFLILGDDYLGTTVGAEGVDTLGRWAGIERHVSSDSRFWNPVGMAATTLYAGRGAYTVVGTNDPVDIVLFHGMAPLTRVRGGYSLRKVLAEERRDWSELFLAMFPQEEKTWQRKMLDESTIRDSYPAFGALSVDADGRIWVGDYPRLLTSSGSGRSLDPVEIPLALSGFLCFVLSGQTTASG